MAECYKFYRYLRDAKYNVIVVPDHEDATDICQYADFDWLTHVPAATNLGYRFALYEGALANFCSANGPPGMLFYSNSPVTQFDQMRADQIKPKLWRNLNGFDVGGQFPWSKSNQKMPWSDSTFDNLVAEWKVLDL